MVPTEGALAYILQFNDLETLKGIDRCQGHEDGRVWLLSARQRVATTESTWSLTMGGFRFHQSDAAVSSKYGHLSLSAVYIYAVWVLLISFPIDLNESQLQLDLVCNGKAVNVAMKLQISCSETGEWNRYLIDRIWKGESKSMSHDTLYSLSDAQHCT